MTKNTRKDVYQIITDEVIKGLEDKGLNWFKCWKETGLAINHTTGRAYTRLNQLMLTYYISALEYKSREFITFKKAKELGGQVIKGAKSHIVVYWLISYYTLDDKGQRKYTKTSTGREDEHKSFTPRYYRVFNLDFVEGLDDKWEENKGIEGTIFEPRENADLIYTNMINKPTLRHAGDRAFYQPSKHHIQMPLQSSFDDSDSYYKVLFHELVHSTGHEDLLNRKTLVSSSGFGSTNYSKEELVAEMGCMFLCAVLDLEPKDNKVNSQAYINGWVKKLKEQPKMILQASTQSEKAVEYILTGKK